MKNNTQNGNTGSGTGTPGGWQLRRFWDVASVRQDDADGWQVLLDDRILRTPGKQVLTLPTQGLAAAIAGEWQAQGEVVDFRAMPLTMAANTAVERVGAKRDEVVAMLAEYGATDLLSYRAEGPHELVAVQTRDWDPLLYWLHDEYGARLVVTQGVMPVNQPAEALQRLHRAVDAYGAFGLTALHDLVTLPGSLVLGLAVLAGRLDAAEAHLISRHDEEHQARQWGRDAEAEALAGERLRAMQSAEKLWQLIQPACQNGVAP